MKRTKGVEYNSPAVEVIDLASETVLCTSAPTPWYRQGGQGDFDYTVDEEDGWA
ncbi:MAG: hypothetical protein ACI3ZK_03895 [Candidatus Cryptobacteroides sp.]